MDVWSDGRTGLRRTAALPGRVLAGWLRRFGALSTSVAHKHHYKRSPGESRYSLSTHVPINLKGAYAGRRARAHELSGSSFTIEKISKLSRARTPYSPAVACAQPPLQWSRAEPEGCCTADLRAPGVDPEAPSRRGCGLCCNDHDHEAARHRRCRLRSDPSGTRTQSTSPSARSHSTLSLNRPGAHAAGSITTAAGAAAARAS